MIAVFAQKIAASIRGSAPKSCVAIYKFVMEYLEGDPDTTFQELADSFPGPEMRVEVEVNGVEYEVYRDDTLEKKDDPYYWDRVRFVQVQRTRGPKENKTKDITLRSLERYYTNARKTLCEREEGSTRPQ